MNFIYHKFTQGDDKKVHCELMNVLKFLVHFTRTKILNR